VEQNKWLSPKIRLSVSANPQSKIQKVRVSSISASKQAEREKFA
jgi:hypothetical protein